MTDTGHLSRLAPVASPAAGAPSDVSMFAGQVRYSMRSFWRTPIAAFFTLLFPLSFLVVVCAIAGNEVIDSRSGVRVAQFLTPVFAVFGACMAAFVSLALGVAYAREAGVLKRLRSTPLPSWIHLAGRVGTAVLVSLIAIAVVTAVGVVLYDVDIVWSKLPAVLVTLVVGVACFAALGLAVVSLTRTPGATQAVANGGLILLAFVSDVFVVKVPDWLDSAAWLFPLKPFVNAVADGFNPFLPGNGFQWDHLGALIAWGVVGALIALRYFTWEPTPARVGRRHRDKVPEPTPDETAIVEPEVPTEPAATAVPTTLSATVDVGAKSWASLALAQTKFTTVKLLRDPLSVFFAIAFPLILLVFFSATYGREATWNGLPLPQYMAAVFSVYGVAVMAYVNLSSLVAEDRSRLVLKRLRGTPLPSGAYLAGRIGAAVVLGALTVVLVFGVGAILFGVRVGLVPLVLTALVFAVIITSMTALGLLIVSLVESPQSVTAVALATLLPLSMISDIFISAPKLPTVMSAIGWAFPLRHMANAAVTVSSGGALDLLLLGHIGVIALCGVVAALLASRLFRWEPRS